jgi:gamma-tubulin complex component 3
MFPELKRRLNDLGQQFHHKVSTLLGDLAYQPDTDMRFLGVVMNFNDFYQPQRPIREKGASSGRKK